ncbi:MAG: proline racemase [Chloroflexi bacterium]|nr:proline racemase [Chloroflexota bacterium]
MRFRRWISAVDAHTEGMYARVVTGGVPHIPGQTMVEKWQWAQQNLDGLRTLLMFEPRGNSLQSGSIVTAPSSPEADVGVIFIEVSGFLPMCGHMTIATCTVLVETGMVDVREPVTLIALDTPAGIVRAEVRVEDGVARDVTFRNVPVFVHSRDVVVHVPGRGPVTLDIAWGGNFYAILPADRVGLELSGAHARDIVDMGTRIREAVYEQVPVAHPENPAINRCTHVRFVAPPTHPRAHARNAVFFGTEAIDRSPCGTGTSAEIALRYARGEIELNQEFVSESIIGSLFYGRAVEETRVGPFPAVVSTIRGSAYITGLQQFVLDPRDPWPNGFYLGPRSKWGTDF